MSCSKCRRKSTFSVPSLLWHEVEAESMWTVQIRRPVHIGLPTMSRYLSTGEIVRLPFSVVRTLLNAEPPFVHFLSDEDRARYDSWTT